MSQQLILVKHSIPEIKEDLPAHQWSLSKEGIERAGQLAERLVAFQPQTLVSSPEPKAMETAGTIARRHQLSLQVVHDLHEHERSNVPFLSKQDFDRSVRKFFINADRQVFGNETAEEACERFSRAVHSILDIYQDRTIVVVSHGTVISLFVSRLTGLPGYSLWNRLGLPGFIVLEMSSRSMVALENIV